jgi:hypothetical protein
MRIKDLGKMGRVEIGVMQVKEKRYVIWRVKVVVCG